MNLVNIWTRKQRLNTIIHGSCKKGKGNHRIFLGLIIIDLEFHASLKRMLSRCHVHKHMNPHDYKQSTAH